MSAMEDDGLPEDLLPDDLTPRKGRAVPLARTPAQRKKAEQARAERERAADLARARSADEQRHARLAQIVNLHIGGYSLARIGHEIGATEAEVDRMLTSETQRYVRTQPALRTYVRNFISEKYTGLLEAVYTQATDVGHDEKLENSAQALRILKEMARLHGAEAPTQTEVKVEAAPEAVEALVSRLAAQQGLGYDTDIFDVVPGEVVQDAHTQAQGFLETSAREVEESDGHDDI